MKSDKGISIRYPVLGSKLNKKSQLAQLELSSKAPPVRNTLDSTAPTIKRGKERERPKKKRCTKMKKIIVLERAEKKQLKSSESTYNELLNTQNQDETDNCDANKTATTLDSPDSLNLSNIMKHRDVSACAASATSKTATAVL